MSFECKHKNNDYCELRRLECVPGEKGCVLTNRVKFVSPPAPVENETRKRRSS